MAKISGSAPGIEASSGNVFADLKVADAEFRLVRAKLANLIASEITRQRLTTAQAAALMQLTPPDVSDLKCGRLKNFSLEQLASCLNHLGYDLRIQVAHGPRWNQRTGVMVQLVSD